MKATRHAVFDVAFGTNDDAPWDAYKALPRGAYEFRVDKTGQRWMWFKCPGNCGEVTTIAIRPVLQPERLDVPSWEWDGNEDAPTLNPSIHHLQCWHGWLTAGEFHT